MCSVFVELRVLDRANEVKDEVSESVGVCLASNLNKHHMHF